MAIRLRVIYETQGAHQNSTTLPYRPGFSGFLTDPRKPHLKATEANHFRADVFGEIGRFPFGSTRRNIAGGQAGGRETCEEQENPGITSG